MLHHVKPSFTPEVSLKPSSAEPGSEVVADSEVAAPVKPVARVRHRDPCMSPSDRLEKRLKLSRTRNNSAPSIGTYVESDSDPEELESSAAPKPDHSDGFVWMERDGCYMLDKSEQSQLGIMTQFLSDGAADMLEADLTKHIPESCEVGKAGKYRIECRPADCKRINTDPPKTHKAKAPICEWDTRQEGELSNIVRHLSQQVKKQVAECFSKEVDFQHVIVNKLSEPSDFILYESFCDNENSQFSPTVAVVALGGSRPMFLKAKTSSNITHRIRLTKGSLYLLSGQSEQTFRHNIPRGWGVPGTPDMTLYFVEKPPVVSMIPLTSDIKEQYSAIEEPACCSKTEKDPAASEENQLDVEEQEEASKVCTTPTDNTFVSPISEIKDEGANLEELLHNDNSRPAESALTKPHKSELEADTNDYEEDPSFILARSMDAGVDSLDEQKLIHELQRNHLPTSGSSDEQRRRLKTSLYMKIGELWSSSSAPDPMKLLGNQSTDAVPSADFEVLLTAHAQLEGAVKDQVDKYNKISSDIQSVRELLVSSGNNQSPSQKPSDSLNQLNRNLESCLLSLNDVKELVGEVKKASKLLTEAREDISSVKSQIRDTKSDLEGYYNSAFYHEDSEKIDQILAAVSSSSKNHHFPRLPPPKSTPRLFQAPGTRRKELPAPYVARTEIDLSKLSVDKILTTTLRF